MKGVFYKRKKDLKADYWWMIRRFVCEWNFRLTADDKVSSRIKLDTWIQEDNLPLISASTKFQKVINWIDRIRLLTADYLKVSSLNDGVCKRNFAGMAHKLLFRLKLILKEFKSNDVCWMKEFDWSCK